MAILRGESMKALRVSWDINGPEWNQIKRKFRDEIVNAFNREFLKKPYSAPIEEMLDTKLGAYFKRKLKSEAKAKAEMESISIFGTNLRSLLLTQPVKIQTAIMSIDPGFSNGCKCAIVSGNGKILDTFKVNLRSERRMIETLNEKLSEFNVHKICVGDGCGNHEAEIIVSKVVKKSKNVTFCRIREAGASVYSCSEIGIADLPNRSPTERGAITLARRIINPLQELVKVEPKSLGIGQYQHNLSPKQLDTELDQILEECVSFVGVDINTADEHLLARIAGLNKTRAKSVIEYINENGPITDLDQLTKIKGIGPKSFKQCAGFMRIYPETANQKGMSLFWK